MACVSVTAPQISAALLLFLSSELEGELNGVYSHFPIRFPSPSPSSKFLSCLSTFVQEDLNNQGHTNSRSRALTNEAMGILLAGNLVTLDIGHKRAA